MVAPYEDAFEPKNQISESSCCKFYGRYYELVDLPNVNTCICFKDDEIEYVPIVVYTIPSCMFQI